MHLVKRDTAIDPATLRASWGVVEKGSEMHRTAAWKYRESCLQGHSHYAALYGHVNLSDEESIEFLRKPENRQRTYHYQGLSSHIPPDARQSYKAIKN